MTDTKACPQCATTIPAAARTCSNCGAGTVSLKDAYLQTDLKKGGFGLLDVIPGVRDLPVAAKVVLLVVILGALLILVNAR